MPLRKTEEFMLTKRRFLFLKKIIELSQRDFRTQEAAVEKKIKGWGT